MKPHWAWKLAAVSVGLAGGLLVLFVAQCFYFMLVKGVRVFFPLVGYPICLGLAYLCIQAPFLVFRSHGPRARIQTLTCGIVAFAIVGVLFGPLLFAGDYNDFEDDFLNAVWRGEVAKVVQMLDAGENPNKRDSCGNSPMTLASFAGQTEVASVLLRRGADVQERDGAGETPLHCAAYYGRIDTIRLLLEHGADLDATNHYGETPIALAKGKGLTEAVEVMRQHEIRNRTMQSSVPVTRGTPPAGAGAAPESPVR